jgi:parvulin-like peptidyl-prolyl isomerase
MAAESESVDSIHWSTLAYDLGLQGLAQEIAVNSTLDRLDDHRIRLSLNSEIFKLADSQIEDEIRQAIASKLGVSLKLELVAQDQLLVETPRLFLQRRLQERRLAAIDEIKRDSIVRKLGDVFGAELVESSVRNIDDTAIPGNGD